MFRSRKTPHGLLLLQAFPMHSPAALRITPMSALRLLASSA